jgi:hypothetical protein
VTRAEPTGAERLRAVCKTMDATPESFLDAFSPAEIIAIFEAHFAASWDYCPSTWTPRQVREAIRGTTPRWNATGTKAEYAPPSPRRAKGARK